MGMKADAVMKAIAEQDEWRGFMLYWERECRRLIADNEPALNYGDARERWASLEPASRSDYIYEARK